MNAQNINSCHSLTYKVLTTSQPDYLHNYSYLCSVYRQNLLLVSCHPSSTTRIFVITNHQPIFHIGLCIHLTCGISSLLHSVNLILFTVLLVHLILRISPHHSHQLRSHHPSLPLPFTPDLKLISFTNLFLHSHSYSFRTALNPLMDLILY